jgi:UDP-N-acetylglucosamine--N-acetylmuramyl-(pentapeptide) pyrophosphoryl-undecaprenol N-acetylglucosamine transferase
MKPQSSPRRRILYYAINGVGIGHVRRLVALARPLRQLALEGGINIEQVFLTSSEAGQLLFKEGFAYLKLTSLDVVRESGLETGPYREFAKQWVAKTITLLNPDVFVVDTFPRGAFGELSHIGSVRRRRILIYRPSKAERAREDQFHSGLTDYDRVLVPESEENSKAVMPACLEERPAYYGPVIARDRHDLLSREMARSRLGLDSKSLVIYVSLGGGGHVGVGEMFSWILAALKEMDNISIVVGAGPLYRGLPCYGKNLVWLVDASVCELMNAFDFAISAAGYNSFCELMHFGVPTIFVPLPCGLDDQEARAERAVKAGAGQTLRPYASREEIHRALSRWFLPGVRAEAAERARLLVPHNHAKEMAAEILRTALSENKSATFLRRLVKAEGVSSLVHSVAKKMKL